MDDSLEFPVNHNFQAGRFEISMEGHMAVLEYELEGGRMVFTYTRVPEALARRGLASRLVFTGLEYARRHNLKVESLCSFVSSYIQKHPEYQDLVDIQPTT
jgi:hypothetical protein